MTKPAPAPTVLAVALTEDDLIEILRRRRHALGMSQIELDERAGLQDGYTGKLECPNGVTRKGKRWGRRATTATLAIWAGGLDCCIAIIPKNLLAAPQEGASIVLAPVAEVPPPDPVPGRRSINHVAHVDGVNPAKRRREKAAEAA